MTPGAPGQKVSGPTKLNKLISHHHHTITIISRVIEVHKEYLDRKESNFMLRDPKS